MGVLVGHDRRRGRPQVKKGREAQRVPRLFRRGALDQEQPRRARQRRRRERGPADQHERRDEVGGPGPSGGVLLPQQEQRHAQGLERRGEAGDRGGGADLAVALERAGHRRVEQHEGERRGAQDEEGLGGRGRVPPQGQHAVDHEAAEAREREPPHQPDGDADEQRRSDPPPKAPPVAARSRGPDLRRDAVYLKRGEREREAAREEREKTICEGRGSRGRVFRLRSFSPKIFSHLKSWPRPPGKRRPLRWPRRPLVPVARLRGRGPGLRALR